MFQLAFTGFNAIPSVLLGLVVVYWLTVIIGLLDMDFLDFDLDAPEDAGGFFQNLLVFMNLAEVPFMLVFSLLTLNFWVLTMLAALLPIPVGGWITGALFIPILALAMSLTKLMTHPLKKVFSVSEQAHDKKLLVMGNQCTLLSDVSPGRLGQAEILMEGAPVLIQVRTEGDALFLKGDKALVVGQDAEKDVYFISHTSQ